MILLYVGESHSLEEFVEMVFLELSLNWKNHVIIDKKLFRPHELKFSAGSPKKAKKILNWESRTPFPELIKKLLNSYDKKI